MEKKYQIFTEEFLKALEENHIEFPWLRPICTVCGSGWGFSNRLNNTMPIRVLICDRCAGNEKLAQ